MKTRISFAILALSLMLGCSPDFDEVWLVIDLRILAANNSPQEFVFPGALVPSDQSPLGLAPQPPAEAFEASGVKEIDAEMTLLVADPSSTPGGLSYTLYGCLLDGNLECESDGPKPKLASGNITLGETKIPFKIPKDLVIASLQADPLLGYAGASVWLVGEVRRGEEKLNFLKQFVVTPDYLGTRTPNTNPQIVEFLMGEKDNELPVALTDGKLVLKAGETVRLVPSIPPEDRETFQAPSTESLISACPALEEVTEEMTVRYFCTCGSLSADRKMESVNIFLETEDKAQEKELGVEYTAPDEPGDCTLWFVAYDGRGGTGWNTLTVKAK